MAPVLQKPRSAGTPEENRHGKKNKKLPRDDTQEENESARFIQEGNERKRKKIHVFARQGEEKEETLNITKLAT
jgi:hypothetical protein